MEERDVAENLRLGKKQKKNKKKKKSLLELDEVRQPHDCDRHGSGTTEYRFCTADWYYRLYSDTKLETAGRIESDDIMYFLKDMIAFAFVFVGWEKVENVFMAIKKICESMRIPS